MITLIDPANWVARIKSTCPIFGQRAFEALAVNSFAFDMQDTPMAMVHVAEDESQPSIGRDSIEQIHDYQIAVKIGIEKTYSQFDHLHGADAQLIRACRQELFDGLLGWKPPDANQRVQHISGKLSEQEGFLIWTDLFTTRDILRKPYG